MPSSFDHCNVCSFSNLEEGDRSAVAVEHLINMDQLHGRTGIPDKIRARISAQRLEASKACAQMIVNGECTIYELNNGHLAEREE